MNNPELNAKITMLVTRSPKLTYREICQILDIRMNRISRVIHDMGIGRTKGPTCRLDRPKILKYMRDNPTVCYQAIADLFNVHKVSIQKLASLNGLERARDGQ